MRPPLPERTVIRVIRFTRRIARQCHPNRPGFLDWMVCDAIANGSRQATGRPGAHGGLVMRFEKAFPFPGGAAVTLRVLGELTPGGCLALHVLDAARTHKKMSNTQEYFNRTGHK
jgi:hypothetical protein